MLALKRFHDTAFLAVVYILLMSPVSRSRLKSRDLSQALDSLVLLRRNTPQAEWLVAGSYQSQASHLRRGRQLHTPVWRRALRRAQAHRCAAKRYWPWHSFWSRRNTSRLRAVRKQGCEQFILMGGKRICDRGAFPRKPFLHVLGKKQTASALRSRSEDHGVRNAELMVGCEVRCGGHYNNLE